MKDVLECGCGRELCCRFGDCWWCGSPHPNAYVAKSQKAKAFMKLFGEGLTTFHIMRAITVPANISREELKHVLDKHAVLYNSTLFVRPCPIVPRHGFVDSRPMKAKDVDGIWGILQEVLAVEPEGEVMLGDFIQDAKYSAIWTPGLLTVGEGNDGATSGKQVVSYPLVTPNKLGQFPMHDVGILHCPRSDKYSLNTFGVSDTPYMELVQADGANYLTQIRNGPRVESVAPDYIPKKVTVETVLMAGGDLLEWETLTQQCAKKSGTVVYHPGGSMTDHYAVHARSHQIPVCVTFKPKVGDTLEALQQETEPDPQAVLEGLLYGAQVNFNTLNSKVGWDSAVALIPYTLHNSAAMTGSYGRWLGLAAALMLRFGAVAMRGEVRHLNPNNKSDRMSVYSRYTNKSLTFHRACWNRLTNAFRHGNFRSAGFGGVKWAQCGLSLKDLFNASKALCEAPNGHTVGQLIRALNIATHQAHNNGWWLNKFVSTDMAALAAGGNLRGLIWHMDGIHWLGHAMANAKVDQHLQKQIADWPHTELKAPVAKNVTCYYDHGKGLVLNIDARLVRNHTRQFYIPEKVLVPKLMDKGLGTLGIKTDGPDWVLWRQFEGEEPQELWRDTPLELEN